MLFIWRKHKYRKENTEALLKACKEVGLEVKAVKIKEAYKPCRQSAI